MSKQGTLALELLGVDLASLAKLSSRICRALLRGRAVNRRTAQKPNAIAAAQNTTMAPMPHAPAGAGPR